MSCNLQLQRNTRLFLSTIDIDGGAAVADMTPSNTWRIKVLAGYAVSQAAATQDITALESGTTPDRSTTRFNTAIDPVEWNFQVYIRPTGAENGGDNGGGDGISESNNVKAVADWFLWQALMSSTKAATSGGAEDSAWQVGGSFDSVDRSTSTNVAAHSSNFGSAPEYNLYVRMDNIFYQVKQTSVNEATVDATIDSIATTTWTGFGTDLVELTGIKRNNAVSVFGGTLNDGSIVKRNNAVSVFGGTLNDGSAATGNANVLSISETSAYHTWGSYNVAGTLTTSEFIKNRLSSIDINFTPDGGSNTNYVFPVTALSWAWTNNITYLTPEELAALNTPIGNFTGARSITSSITAYLRHDTAESAQFLRDVTNDTRTSHSVAANANVIIGGATAPYMAFYLPATQFEFPVHNIDDIISITGGIQAQEPATSCGAGGEVELFSKRA